MKWIRALTLSAAVTAVASLGLLSAVSFLPPVRRYFLGGSCPRCPCVKRGCCWGLGLERYF